MAAKAKTAAAQSVGSLELFIPDPSGGEGIRITVGMKGISAETLDRWYALIADQQREMSALEVEDNKLNQIRAKGRDALAELDAQYAAALKAGDSNAGEVKERYLELEAYFQREREREMRSMGTTVLTLIKEQGEQEAKLATRQLLERVRFIIDTASVKDPAHRRLVDEDISGSAFWYAQDVAAMEVAAQTFRKRAVRSQ